MSKRSYFTTYHSIPSYIESSLRLLSSTFNNHITGITNDVNALPFAVWFDENKNNNKLLTNAMVCLLACTLVYSIFFVYIICLDLFLILCNWQLKLI